MPGMSPGPSASIKVVVRYVDGRVEKHLAKPTVSVTRRTFQILTEDGLVKAVPLAELKAIFFVKDLAGNPRYEERKSLGKDSPRVGYQVRVTFHDGEQLVGRSMNPSFDDHGFYMEPADPASNNDRIFVVRSSVASIEVLPG